MGRRKGIHTAEFSDRRRARRGLRPFWRPRLGDGDLLRRQPCGDRADRPFLLPPCQAWHGRLAAVGDCGRLLPHNDLAGSRSGGAVQRGQSSRHPLYSSWFHGALSHLLVFFLKTDSLTFGSGLVIVPFLEKDLVQQTGWLNGSEFLVAGFWGSLGRVVN